MGLAPYQGNGWVRFQPAPSRKVGQISTGVDKEPNLRAFLAQQKELLAAPLEMRSYATLPE